MLISTAHGMKLHHHRMDEMRETARLARLIADLPRTKHSFILGNYTLNLFKEAPHVSRLV